MKCTRRCSLRWLIGPVRPHFGCSIVGMPPEVIVQRYKIVLVGIILAARDGVCVARQTFTIIPLHHLYRSLTYLFPLLG